MAIDNQRPYIRSTNHRNTSEDDNRYSILLHHGLDVMPIIELMTVEKFDKYPKNGPISYSTAINQLTGALQNLIELSMQTGNFNEVSYDAICEAYTFYLEKRAPFSRIQEFLERKPW